MKKIDIARISLGNFGRRKTRSILSVLGVVIGTASIVVMMSLGIAMNVSFNEQLDRYGNMTQINVSAGYNSETGEQKKLDEKALEQISAIEGVTAITPTVGLSGKMFSGKYQNYAQITGINLEFLKALGTDVDRGRMLTEQDISSGKRIYCVMGASVPFNFEKPQRTSGGGMSWGGAASIPDGADVPDGGWAYGGVIYDENGKEVGTYLPEIDPLDESTNIKYTFDWSYGESYPGQTLGTTKKAKLYTVETVGILKRGGNDYVTYIDLNTAMSIKKEMEKWQNSQSGGTATAKKSEASYDEILVLAKDIQQTMDVTKAIQALGYNAYGNADWINQQQETQKMLQTVLAGIGAVSLLVAAIGIANTMIMSIYERTREIGIMKVIGCYLKDIRTMFLIEAGFIGLFGGMAGVLLSYGVSALLNWAASGGNNVLGSLGIASGSGSALSVIPFWLAALAIVFAIFIALVSGFFPARRAMRLSALEAMKN